ncbi:hypothetical protein BD309DRAFT_1018927 [Dichomitus squalens]|uniref:Uncharacterized protein n=1 Tax=Dichomitus squalens TaxID=114155 RepID=A0A4Q9NQV3_9APHY|nr:hypothetical protein BD309DRAFT_1018927 [Dichomitus squalens]TBU53735.1 hypothetical protein BD310DRAFT_829490 [Dichomitus squalens]
MSPVCFQSVVEHRNRAHDLHYRGTDFIHESLSSGEELIEVIVVDNHPCFPSLSKNLEQNDAMPLQLFPLMFLLWDRDEMFGLSGEYKRASALFDDTSCQAPRREWSRTATAAVAAT